MLMHWCRSKYFLRYSNFVNTTNQHSNAVELIPLFLGQLLPLFLGLLFPWTTFKALELQTLQLPIYENGIHPGRQEGCQVKLKWGLNVWKYLSSVVMLRVDKISVWTATSIQVNKFQILLEFKYNMKRENKIQKRKQTLRL